MEDENKDANNEEIADSSSDVELEPIKTDEGLISTTEFVEVQKEELKPEEDSKKDTETSEDAEPNTSKPESDKKDFHDHPRFKELVDEKNTSKQAINDLTKEIESLKQSKTYQAPAEESAFSKILSMQPDELIEEMTENPHEFFKNFAQQQRTEIEESVFNKLGDYQKQNQAQSLETRQLETFNTFFDENPEAKTMWDSGKLEDFMKENPGHNAISAYQSLNSDNIIAEASEKAVKEALEKNNKQLKAAGKAGSFSGPTGQPSVSTKDPELKNPEKHGGKTAVMLKRWMARSA